MENNRFTADLLDFLSHAHCNFQAVARISERLEKAGFTYLSQNEPWDLQPGGKYYITKNDSAIFAFVVGTGEPSDGFHIIAAHSDSPGFRIKPNAEMVTEGNMLKLNTEVYGGPILYTWFDRPLSIAGRVISKGNDPMRPVSTIIDFETPLLTIPHLAIHYNRSVNEGNPLSKQTDMLPIISLLEDKTEGENFIAEMISDQYGIDMEDILDYDLFLYDSQPACLFGAYDEFISSGRIDDLEMAHCATTALIESISTLDTVSKTRVVAIFDNEETGSGTKQGAASPELRHLLERIILAQGGDREDFFRAIDNSFLVSADNGHATHPNYIAKQDPTNHPILGKGPVVKVNANCKYMTDADSAAVFKSICSLAGVPVQTFVNHSDVAGGSTLGNILTSQLPLRGVDMGAPQLAMHSCRETAAVADHLYTIAAFTTFLSL